METINLELFVNGTMADAAPVNENFNKLKSAVLENRAEIENLDSEVNLKLEQLAETINETINTVVEAWTSGKSWYRKWSDGWIEQGGVVLGTSTAASVVTVNLNHAMADTNYTVATSSEVSPDTVLGNTQAAQYLWQVATMGGSVAAKTVNSFKMSNYYAQHWYVCGKGV